MKVGISKLKNENITFKDLSKGQLNALKSLYVNTRVESMSTDDLRKFVKEVLELQVAGTVGNEEEKEVWKEMKDFFNESFDQKIKEIATVKDSEALTISPEQQEFQKRLEAIEQRKNEEINSNQDMW